MAKALTAKAVEAAKPRTVNGEAKRRHIPDGGTKGLYLIVQPSGAKSWAVWYMHGGRQKKLTLGPYPAFKLKDAREAASAALRKVAEGADPAAEKKRAKREARDTSNLIRELGPIYLAARAKRKNWKPSYQKEATRLFSVEILPHWGDKRIQEITRDDVSDLLGDIVERSVDADGRGITANRVYATIISPMMQWAVDRRKIPASPLPSKEALLDEGALVEERARDRFLVEREIKWFWKACCAEAGVFGPFYLFALLTGQRRSEIGGMTDAELDREARQWRIPGERTKNGLPHVVPLPDLALRIIDAVPRVRNEAGYIFCTNGRTPISGYSRAKARIAEAMELEAAKDGITIERWTPHDLRRTLVTIMNEKLRIAPHVVEACVNHISGAAKQGVAGVYNRATYLSEREAAFDAWADYLETLVADKPKSNVVRLEPPAA